MTKTACGAEIVQIVDALPYEELIRTEDVAGLLADRLSIPHDKARAAVNVRLKRMADRGTLKRLSKGVYCRVRQTVFGPIAPDIDQIALKSVTVRDGNRIGYESGAGLLNHLGLSTLLPRKIEVTTNEYRAKLPEGCHIKLTKPAVTITDDNWRYLQFIDAAVCLPEAHIDAEAPARLLNTLAKKQGLEPLALIFLARKHYPAKTVLRLTDLLMEADNEPASR